MHPAYYNIMYVLIEYCILLFSHVHSHLFQIKNVPDTVLDRRHHSMDVIAMSASTMWVLVTGGRKGALGPGVYVSPMLALIEMSE